MVCIIVVICNHLLRVSQFTCQLFKIDPLDKVLITIQSNTQWNQSLFEVVFEFSTLFNHGRSKKSEFSHKFVGKILKVQMRHQIGFVIWPHWETIQNYCCPLVESYVCMQLSLVMVNCKVLFVDIQLAHLCSTVLSMLIQALWVQQKLPFVNCFFAVNNHLWLLHMYIMWC